MGVVGYVDVCQQSDGTGSQRRCSALPAVGYLSQYISSLGRKKGRNLIVLVSKSSEQCLCMLRLSLVHFVVPVVNGVAPSSMAVSGISYDGNTPVL